jgi:hypothetical protein
MENIGKSKVYMKMKFARYVSMIHSFAAIPTYYVLAGLRCKTGGGHGWVIHIARRVYDME